MGSLQEAIYTTSQQSKSPLGMSAISLIVIDRDQPVAVPILIDGPSTLTTGVLYSWGMATGISIMSDGHSCSMSERICCNVN
jgi:hypothetical protein